MNASLEDQLTALEIAVPPALGSRALAAAAQPTARHHRRHRRRTALAGVGVVAAIAGANIAAAEYVPAYREFAQVLPFIDDPATQQLVDVGGLPDDKVTIYNDVAIDAGYEIRLLGAYADTLRTTLVLQLRPIDPDDPATMPWATFDNVELVDSAGRVYAGTDGAGRQSPSEKTTGRAASFEPLEGDAAAGGELTLRITALQGPNATYVDGLWEFKLGVVQQDAPILPAPAEPIVVGDTQFTVESVQASGYQLRIMWSAEGGAVDRYEMGRTPEGDVDVHLTREVIPHLAPGTLATTPTMLRLSTEQDAESWALRGEARMTLTSPGDYLLKFGTADQPGWPITIPE